MLWHDGETSGFYQLPLDLSRPASRHRGADEFRWIRCRQRHGLSSFEVSFLSRSAPWIKPGSRRRGEIFEQLRAGKLDRTLLSPNANVYFTLQTVQDIAGSIAPLGPIQSFELKQSGTRGGMDYRTYEIKLAKRQLSLVTRSLPDGKLEQYMISAK